MELLLSGNQVDWTSVGLMTAIIIVSVLLGAAFIFAFIARIMIWTTYRKFNKIANSEGLTAIEAAEKFKNIVGVNDVNVQQCSWWRALLSTGGAMGFGNNYSIYKKTIFLRKNIINKTSLTAVGVGTQKVGLALQDKEGNKMYQFTARAKPIVFFAPVLFLPLAFLGVLIDLFVLNGLGVFTILFTGLGLVYYVVSFLVLLFTIKTEKHANATALKLMNDNNFLTEEERKNIAKLYNTYILAYVADFIVALLEIILKLLKLLLKMQQKAKR